MENYLDYKATVWFRIPIEDADKIPEMIKDIERGKTPNEIFNDLYEEDEFLSCEIIDETEEYITPLDNAGEETMEIYKGDRNVWTNKKMYS